MGAAVVFLGESFSRINALGLCVLVAGVALFNYSKYRKIASGQARTGKPSPFGAASHREDGADGDEESMRLMPRVGSGASPPRPKAESKPQKCPRCPGAAWKPGIAETFAAGPPQVMAPAPEMPCIIPPTSEA